MSAKLPPVALATTLAYVAGVAWRGHMTQAKVLSSAYRHRDHFAAATRLNAWVTEEGCLYVGSQRQCDDRQRLRAWLTLAMIMEYPYTYTEALHLVCPPEILRQYMPFLLKTNATRRQARESALQTRAPSPSSSELSTEKCQSATAG